MTTNTIIGIGSSKITTLGTITTGTWNGTAVDAGHGGTGASSFTAYSVLCAGTTSAGIFQNVSGVGSSTNVLTSNGAGALPTWQAAPGDKLVKIQAITASNQATVEFDSKFSSTYDVYMFTFTNVIPVTNNVIFYSQLGTGGTPTWTTSGYKWQSEINVAGSVFLLNSTSDAQIVLNQNQGTYGANSSFSGMNGYLYIIGTNNTSNFGTGVGQLGYITATTQYCATSNVSFYVGAATYTSVKFYFSSGNVSSGTITMYGLAKS